MLLGDVLLLVGAFYLCTALVPANNNATHQAGGGLARGPSGTWSDSTRSGSRDTSISSISTLPLPSLAKGKGTRERPRTSRAKKTVPPVAELKRYHFPYWPQYPANPLFQMCHLEDFTFGKRLGRGGFGQVYRATHKSGKQVAMKVVSKDSISKNGKHVANEEIIHHSLNCQYIGKHLCTMKNEQHDIFFANELFEGGNMSQQLAELHPLSRDLVVKYIAQTILALRHMHTHCIIYRDLKSENIMLDRNDNIKLIDFGLAVFDCENKLSNFAGTIEYVAPEVAGRRRYGRAADYYSAGVLVYLLAMGRLPYRYRKSMDRQEFISQIASGKLQIPLTGDDALDELIGVLTTFDPEERFSRVYVDFDSFKKRSFFEGFDWEYYEYLALSN